MSVEDNVALMRNLYDAYSRKDAAPLFENLGEAVQFQFVGHPDQFTFAGSHLGKDGVQRALELVARSTSGWPMGRGTSSPRATASSP